MIKTEKKDKKSFSFLETKNLLKSKKCLFLTFTPLEKKFLKKKIFKVTKKINKKNKKISVIYNSHGYWYKSEHNKFIEALYQYNCSWTKIASYLQNRTYNQIRSHAQKFYLKLKSFKDEELGLDFTSPHVKNLNDIIEIIKEKELINESCGKLLYIISEKLSFGKNPHKHEDEIINKKKQKNKLHDYEYKNVILDNSSNVNLTNNTNYLNKITQINNSGECSLYIGSKNEQALNFLKNDNIITTNNDYEKDFDSIFTINDNSPNDLVFHQKIVID